MKLPFVLVNRNVYEKLIEDLDKKNRQIELLLYIKDSFTDLNLEYVTLKEQYEELKTQYKNLNKRFNSIINRLNNLKDNYATSRSKTSSSSVCKR